MTAEPTTTSKARNTDPRYSKLTIGTAPDSWGVWFPEDDAQVPYTVFLDEAAQAGYEFIETGPFGYLPTDPQVLKDECAARGITVIAGTQWGVLHKPEAWENTELEMRRNAAVLKAVGAKFLVYLPPMFRDEKTNEFTDDHVLTPQQWDLYASNANRLGKILKDEYGVQMVVHPHGDSHIESRGDIDKFFAATDSEYVKFCLDTGHIVYGGADSVDIINTYPERIAFVHIKQMDPAIVKRAHDEGWGFGEAVKRGVCVTPPAGEPDSQAIIDALADLDKEIFVVVEQDLYPCAPEVPLPIAIQTREFLADCHLGLR